MVQDPTIVKKATLADVAAEVGVTSATASLALSGKGNISSSTRNAVRSAARRLNYHPNPHARSLSHGRSTNRIALFSLQMDLGVATFKLQLIQSLLAEQGYEIPAYLYGYCAPSDVEFQINLVQSLCSQNPQAIICNAEHLDEQALIELRRYQKEGGVVVIYDFPTDLDCDQVIFDREDNTYRATRHLLELGHRKIGFSAVNDKLTGERFRGFCRALREFDVIPHSEWLFGIEHGNFNPRKYNQGCEREGTDLARRIMAMKEAPTALCLLDDLVAVCCAAEFERGGWKVPDDISIVGHDDIPLASCGPLPLTTVIHPMEAIAHNVIELLRERLRNGPSAPARRVVLRGDLVARKSTASPRR